MPIEKVCIVCGNTFLVPPCREKTAKTCSNKCAVSVRAKSRERKVEVACLACGEKFLVPESHEGRRVYCSKSCKYSSGSMYLNTMSERMSGAGNPMWSGGEVDHSDGYVYKMAKNHPMSSNGYVLKHRLVMEEWLREDAPELGLLMPVEGGLYLPNTLIVHHLDGDRKNNDKGNLIVCTRSTHSAIHNGEAVEQETCWPISAKIILGRKPNFRKQTTGVIPE